MTPRPPNQAELRAGTKMWSSKPAVAERAGPSPAKPGMRLVKFTPITSSGAALAYFDIEQASGLITRDWKLMRGPDGKLWLAAPSVKQTDRDGNPVIGDKGKPLYRSFIDFKDRATRDRFTEQVINLVRRERPEVFDNTAAARHEPAGPPRQHHPNPYQQKYPRPTDQPVAVVDDPVNDLWQGGEP